MKLRKIFCDGIKLNKNYGFDWCLFTKIRSFNDGITWFNLICEYDKYLSDHKPSFQFHLCILNYTIIELEIYYLHHRDEEETYDACVDLTVPHEML